MSPKARPPPHTPVPQPTTPVLPTNNLEGLKIAVDDVQKRIVRSAMHHTIHGEKIEIPKELAKSWINVYLECNMGDPFPSLVDPKLLRLLPEIIDYPQLHVDSVTMLTYYCVLHQGASMGRGEAHMEGNWLRKLYTCCIRALARWQHETKGSPEDFYAANLMRRIALENFDQDLAWILFTLACRYAQTLQLHQLDRQGGTGSAAIGKPIEDRDREGLWDLVQTDLLYRLVFDKPPTLTGDPEAWKVNLPKLTSQEDTMEDHTAAIQFLLRSRLTFVLSDYFHILDQWKDKKDPGLISRVEAICIQIKDLYDEWNIDKWVEELTSDALRLWTVSSIAFTGYHCIIYMLRRAVASVHNFSTLDEADDLVFKMPLAQIISKRMLEAARTLFKMDARLDILCVFLGGFNLHVPYIYLARRLLDTTETCPGLDNVDLLDHLAQAIEVIAKQNSEVEPLVEAMKRLNAEIQENMTNAMAGSMAQN
ncbi:hypothetical protein NM208_g11118 [Fusarium decemcellulare]|uniref:Uncharacterized protein n=1 Tax=Fusarium decemcellulare TaxID=57161 RepID=A0ACC1RVG2_9HYPO|nr:hypothetical protein NM208_g11118 [Fusarium decemcellulare]